MAYFPTVTLDPNQMSVDGGGRARTSTLTTLGDYKILGFDKTLLMPATGSGTGSFVNNAFNMLVTGSGQYVVKQSKKYHPYFSGKSQLIECTSIGFQPEVGVEKRFGYFSSVNTVPFSSSYDGFWLQSSGSFVTLNIANSGSSVISVSQSQWTGASQLGNVDWSKFNVTLFDFLWLGGAIARLWMVAGGKWVLAHQYSHSGIGTDMFMRSPNQPVRYEVRCSGSNNSGSFKYVCAQVATEGGFPESGISRTMDISHIALSLGTIGTKYPIIAVKKQTTYRDVPVEVAGLSMNVTTNSDVVLWTLELNPVLSAPLSYINLESSSLQYSRGNGTITVSTSGSILASGYANQGQVIPPNVVERGTLSFLGSKVGDEMDEYVFCAVPVTATPSVLASITTKEY